MDNDYESIERIKELESVMELILDLEMELRSAEELYTSVKIALDEGTPADKLPTLNDCLVDINNLLKKKIALQSKVVKTLAVSVF